MFRVGQKVTPKNSAPWLLIEGPENNAPVPQYGAVYTVAATETYRGVVWLDLAELRDCYAADEFRPVVDISDLSEIVAEVQRGKPRKIKQDKFDRSRVGV